MFASGVRSSCVAVSTNWSRISSASFCCVTSRMIQTWRFVLHAADDADRMAGHADHAALAVFFARQFRDDRPVAILVGQQRIASLGELPAFDQQVGHAWARLRCRSRRRVAPTMSFMPRIAAIGRLVYVSRPAASVVATPSGMLLSTPSSRLCRPLFERLLNPLPQVAPTGWPAMPLAERRDSSPSPRRRCRRPRRNSQLSTDGLIATWDSCCSMSATGRTMRFSSTAPTTMQHAGPRIASGA